MYTFNEWRNIYQRKRIFLQQLHENEINKLYESLEEQRGRGINNLVDLERSLLKIRIYTRNLYGFGKLFPLDIEDMPFEMLSFPYEEHKKELDQLEEVLLFIRAYEYNKENMSLRERVRHMICTLNLLNDILNE